MDYAWKRVTTLRQGEEIELWESRNVYAKDAAAGQQWYRSFLIRVKGYGGDLVDCLAGLFRRGDRPSLAPSPDFGHRRAPAADRVADKPSDIDLYTKLGWSFHPVDDDAKFVDRPSKDIEKVPYSRLIYKYGDAIWIDSRKIVVQFPVTDGSVDEAKVEEIATACKLHRICVTGLHRNVYQFSLQARKKSIEVASTISEKWKEDVLSAEVEFIELWPTDPSSEKRQASDNQRESKPPFEWPFKLTREPTSGDDILNYHSTDGIQVAVIDSRFHCHAFLDEVVNIQHSKKFSTIRQGQPEDLYWRCVEGDTLSTHGTACAGIIGARPPQGTALPRGVYPKSRLTLLDVAGNMNDKKPDVGVFQCTQHTIARAIDYCVQLSAQNEHERGIDVISCSLGLRLNKGVRLMGSLRQALEEAYCKGRGGKGIPIFWAAPPGAVSNANIHHHTAHPMVAAIGASDHNDVPHDTAGGDTLEFLAPGKDLLVVSGWNKNKSDGGSSFAAPFAAGVAALLISKDESLTADEIRAILRVSCDRVWENITENTGHDRHSDYGFGRINALRAVTKDKNSKEVKDAVYQLVNEREQPFPQITFGPARIDESSRPPVVPPAP